MYKKNDSTRGTCQKPF